MINKSRGDNAYSMFDMTGKEVPEETIRALSKIDGVLKVRMI
jgi:D-3-phosphoglycerate dehydrogenase